MPIVDTDRRGEQQPASPNANSQSKGKKKSIPAGLWVKCPECQSIIFKKSLEENFSVCAKCKHHFTLGARERLAQLADEETFQEFDASLQSEDPLQFRAVKTYTEKLSQDSKKTGLSEACVTGKCEMLGHRVAIGITDSRFIMGSMGSVVGEKITRLAERAEAEHLPLVIVSGSGGGARMYEGIFSLMQMAKTSAAIGRAQQSGVLFVSVLTDPTMGGVMASFAGLGDVILAEPHALIGFAGPRVIEQTIRQKLPENFQTSEFLLEHGMVDMVVERKDLKNTIVKLVDYLAR